MKLHRKTLCVGLLLIAGFVGVAFFGLWPFAVASKLAVVAAIIRGALILCVFSIAFGFASKASYAQRACLGLSGSGMLMTVQSLLLPQTPYEIWAAILSATGFLGYFSSVAGPQFWKRIAKLAGEDENA